MTKVKISKPRSRRIKNRIAEHGDVFVYHKTGIPQCFNGERALLLESLDKSWMGWLPLKDLDAEKLSAPEDDDRNFIIELVTDDVENNSE